MINIEYIKKRKRSFIIAVVSICIITLLYSFKLIFLAKDNNSTSKKISNTHYSTMQSIAQEIDNTIEIYGKVEPFYIDIEPAVSGYLKKKYVQTSDFIKKNQPILDLYRPDIEFSLQAAQKAMEVSEINFQSSQELFKNDLISERELKEKEKEFFLANSNFKNLEQQKTHIKVLAPCSGHVTNFDAEEGQYIGLQQGRILKIIKDNPKLIVAHIPESLMHLKHNFKNALAKFSNDNQKNKLVEMHSISPVPEENINTFKIKFLLVDENNYHNIGQTVSLDIMAGKINAHLVPISSINLMDDGSITVKTINKNGDMKYKSISILKDSKEGIWITGLDKEETLVTLVKLGD